MISLSVLRRVWFRVLVSMVSISTIGATAGLSAQVVVPTPIISSQFWPSPALNLQHIRSAQACAAVVRFVDDSVRQYWLLDTIYRDEIRPTPVAVAEIARACLAMFPITRVDTVEFPTILRIALFTGDTIPFSVALDRLLSIRTGAKGRAEILKLARILIMQEDNRSEAPSLVATPFLQAVLARLNALGEGTALEQIFVRRYLYECAERRGMSVDSLLVLARELLIASRRITAGEDASKISKNVTFFNKEVAWYTYLRDGTADAFHAWRSLETEGGLIGNLAPPIKGGVWMGRPTGDDSTLRATTPDGPPFPDRVAIVVGFPDGDIDPLRLGEWDLIRRIHRRFPTVPLVVLAQTTGAVWSQVRIDDPNVEAAMLGRIFLDSLQLPIWLNVSTTTVIDTSRRNANGRPMIVDSKTYEDWQDSRGDISGFYIINRQGYVVRRIRGGWVTPEQIRVLLERLIQFDKPAASS